MIYETVSTNNNIPNLHFVSHAWGVLLCFVLFLFSFLYFLKFVLDENNEYTTEFLGFSVYISNTTNKSEGVLCFRDTLYTKATIPNPIKITFLNHGRYVIYYNNRIEGNHNQYSTLAYNNLCEVEIYGNCLSYVELLFYSRTLSHFSLLTFSASR